MRKIILASASPRRFNLLRDRGYDVTVMPADIDESVVCKDSPEALVIDLAMKKALTVANNNCGSTVIAADTVVCLDGKVLGKPKDRAEAFSMLSQLSDNTHTVYTGVCIIKDGELLPTVESADVTFHPLTKEQIEMYIDTGSPFDKAGGYGIQDDAGIGFVKSVDGELSCVVGLPISAIIEDLEK